MHLRDAYRVLEVADGAGEDAVREARKTLSKVWHPDRYANDPALQAKAETKLREINEAFEVIRKAGFAAATAPVAAAPAPKPAPVSPPMIPAPAKPAPTKGQTSDDVLAVLGTPTRVTGRRWGYGSSEIELDEAGRIVAWTPGDVDLQLRP